MFLQTKNWHHSRTRKKKEISSQTTRSDQTSPQQANHTEALDSFIRPIGSADATTSLEGRPPRPKKRPPRPRTPRNHGPRKDHHAHTPPRNHNPRKDHPVHASPGTTVQGKTTLSTHPQKPQGKNHHVHASPETTTQRKTTTSTNLQEPRPREKPPRPRIPRNHGPRKTTMFMQPRSKERPPRPCIPRNHKGPANVPTLVNFIQSCWGVIVLYRSANCRPTFYSNAVV